MGGNEERGAAVKIERITNTPALFEFLRTRLPDSLRADMIDDGYGAYCTIYVKAEDHAGLWGSFKRAFDPGIATVTSRLVELRRPEYFSDFEALCRDYENLTGEEVTLRYWESDKPR